MRYQFKVKGSSKKSVSLGYPPHSVHYSIHRISTKSMNPSEKQTGNFDTRVRHFEKMYKEGETIPPILVHKADDGSYNVLDGHARLEAYKRLGVKKVPVVENLFGEFVGKTAAAFRGGVSKARESYSKSRERQKYNAEIQLEELKRKARSGNIIVQRYLDKKGIAWRRRPSAPRPLIVFGGQFGNEEA